MTGQILKPVTPENMEKLMLKILKVLVQEEANMMVNFYVNGKHYATDQSPGFIPRSLPDGTLYYEDPSPCDVTKQIEYNNPKTITMTFEGPMYHDINYRSNRIGQAIDRLAAPYGLFSELGFAWSLALYEI